MNHTIAPWELIVSDASDVPITDSIELPTNVTVIPERPRLGQVKGYNVAFRQAKGEFCLWLNDDAEVCPGYDTESLKFMTAHREFGLGALHYSENGGEFHVNSAWGCIYANFGILNRHLGEQVGFFDEDLHMYGSDNSLTIRVLLAGHGVSDIPTARVLHHSEMDQERVNNQAYRSRDNRVLQDKYMPSRADWLKTYRKHLGIADPPENVWPHGVKARRRVMAR